MKLIDRLICLEVILFVSLPCPSFCQAATKILSSLILPFFLHFFTLSMTALDEDFLKHFTVVLACLLPLAKTSTLV